MGATSARASRARIAAALLTLAAAAAVMACGNSGSAPASTPGQNTPTAEATATATAQPATRCDIDLSADSPDATIFGAEAGDFLADRFALATGDFNGDGAADILIGAPLADGPDNSRTNVGEAYVIFGGPNLQGAIDLAAGTAGFTVVGRTPGDNLGFAVAAGDINGDDIDDLLIGARFAGPGGQAQSGEGEAYAIFGRHDLSGSVDIASDQQDMTVTGRRRGDYLGIAVASGDVNGDGVSDLILGASGAAGRDNARGQGGEVYVILGSKSLPSRVELASDEPYLTVYGPQAGALVPNYLASGDVDGDGKAEVIAGAPSAGSPSPTELPTGEAYVIYAPSEAGGQVDLAGSSGFTRLHGRAPLDGFGFYVAAADMNGDHKDDVIVGARDADGPNDSRNNAGEVYIVMGKERLPQVIDVGQTAPDVTILGSEANASLGFTVAAGDVNGDGKEDLLAGAPVGDSCGGIAQDAGQVHVVFGKSHWPKTIDLAQDDSSLSLFGAEAGDELGFSLATGDVNNDGRDDIVAGALQADGPDNARPDSGEAYVILSR
ncbi:MAG TPA: hypothetical protein VFT91_06380 [Dehalococcoidia bacterium]|nr:hypothetical protein [Dehalococcoidia bacterium]